MKTLDEVHEIIDNIRFKDRNFVILESDGKWFLQLQYVEADVHTGVELWQHARKWYISPHATTSEIVQTAFKAVVTSQEHIAREFFKYRDQQVFGPHFNVEDLVELARSGKLDVRTPQK